MQDDLIEEYYQLAQHAENYPKQATYKWARPLLILGFVSLVLFNWATQDSNPASETIKGMGLIGLLGIAIYANINEFMLRKKVVADLIATKPNFEEFYKIYKSEKRKDMLRMAGGIAMGLIAAAASEAQKSYERQRQEEMVRRAVNDELNHHGM